MASQSLTEIRRQLQRLLRLPTGKHWIISCYLKVEPRDRSRGKYLIKLKNRIKEVVEALPAEGLSRAETEQVVADLARVQAALQDPAALPASRGLALFVCKPLGLFEMIPLPRVHRSRLLVDRTALVRELAALEDEVGRLLAAVLDKTGASIYEVTAFETRKLADVEAESRKSGRFHRDRGAPGAGEHGFHNRLRHEREQVLDLVAARLFEIDRKEPVRGIVLASAGNEADALRMFLHPYIAGKVMGTARLGRKGASLGAVASAVLDVRETFERKLERHLVAEMLLGQGSGWAVNGISATLEALFQGPGANPAGPRRRERARLSLLRHRPAVAQREGLPRPGECRPGARYHRRRDRGGPASAGGSRCRLRARCGGYDKRAGCSTEIQMRNEDSG